MSDKKTIKEIKQILFQEICTEDQMDKFKRDHRKGVQQLINRYEKELERKARLKQQFLDMKVFEDTYRQEGKQYIAGIDEAGRGPLAGPVVAAAVILDDSFYLEGLYDSKELKEEQKNSFFDYIQAHSVSYGIGVVHNDEIDELNIYEATKTAMKRAISQLEPAPDQLLIDAVQLHESGVPFEAIVKGDQRSISIAAASVLAKVTRDRYMKQIHDEYPTYDFGSNMGYGTKKHMDALTEHGATPYHRCSFAPVKKVLQSTS